MLATSALRNDSNPKYPLALRPVATAACACGIPVHRKLPLTADGATILSRRGEACELQAGCVGGCGPHGSCHAGQCACDAGWSGTRCQTRSCIGGCGGHGRCDGGVCQCFNGWSGVHCERRVNPPQPSFTALSRSSRLKMCSCVLRVALATDLPKGLQRQRPMPNRWQLRMWERLAWRGLLAAPRLSEWLSRTPRARALCWDSWCLRMRRWLCRRRLQHHHRHRRRSGC